MPADAMEAMETSAVANADHHAMAAMEEAAPNAVLANYLCPPPADTAVEEAAPDAVLAELSLRRAALTVHVMSLSRRPALMALAMSLSRRTTALTVLAMDAPMDHAEEDAKLAKARAATDALTDARNAEVLDAKSAPAEVSSSKLKRLPHPFTRLNLRLRHAQVAEAKDAQDVAIRVTL